MKSFYQHLDEVSKHNRSDENNRFKDQHDVQLFKHPVASEAQHTGEIEGKVGTTKRLADDGTDSNYDAAYIKKTGSDEGGGRRLGEETELQEATDLFDKGGIMITRYSAGGGKLGVQVSVGRNYIQLTEPQMKMLASALPKAQKDLRKGLKNESIEEASCGSKPKKEAYPEVKPNELIKRALMGGKKAKTENQSQDVANKMSDASAPSKEGKKKVTLKKAPWEKNESVELIDEMVRAGNMKLKDGSTVKVSNEDAKLLTTMLKGLNAKNRNEMKNVMMTDKAGYEEIRGFAREAI
jgi:hypothetical protein